MLSCVVEPREMRYISGEEVILNQYVNPSVAYKETRVKTAGQGQLIIMLYDEAVRQLDQAIELLRPTESGKVEPGKIEKIGKSIVKTQEIITELIVSLDFEQGGEIAQNLFSLYSWFNQELLGANIAQDVKRVVAVRTMIDQLRGAWNEVIAKTSAEGVGNPSSGVNIAG